jgi:transposase
MSPKRKHYPKEFKVETVKLVTEGGYSAARVARDMGISTNMLRRWKQQFEENPHAAFQGKGYLLPEAEVVRRLQRENKRLRQERDILRKALAIFSREQC